MNNFDANQIGTRNSNFEEMSKSILQDDSKSPQKIIHLNVGGRRFSTSYSTLTWIQDSFFTSLLNGRISSIEDGNGAIFIDRDPDLFRRILNYLRTKQIDLNNVSLTMLKHEAEFYGLSPLVNRLTLCLEMEDSPCGDVLFHAYIKPPTPPPPSLNSPVLKATFRNTTNDSYVIKSNKQSSMQKSTTFDGAGAEKSKQSASSPSKMCSPSPPIVHSSPQKHRTHSKKNSCDLTKQVRNNLSNLLKLNELSSASMRVRIIRAHHNSVAVAYYNFVCCYRMKESIGWQPIYVSPCMDHPIANVALVSKFGGSLITEKMLAISLTNNTIHLWCLDENNDVESNRKIGTFALSVPIDKLFFIGTQLVALSKTGKVGIWHSMTLNWQVQDVMKISCYDTAGSVLLLGCTNGSIYYFDMQKFPLRMKDNDLLITELYKDPNADIITAISVYLTPKTNLCGNWIEIAYGTNTGYVRLIVQHPETVGHGPQLFQTFTVHTAPITRVALTTNHLISVCSEYNHVRSWSVTRFRGMISTQPGGTSLASFKVQTLDSVEDSLNSEGCDPGPYGDQDGEQIFVQRLVPDANQVFVRLASNGERICTIRSVDGAAITAFYIHECEGSNRMGARPRRYLFTGDVTGSIQMWDMTTAMDQHNARCQLLLGMVSSSCEKSASNANSNGQSTSTGGGPTSGSSSSGSASIAGNIALHNLNINRQYLAILQGPTPEELLHMIDECELCSASLNTTPTLTPHSSALNLDEKLLSGDNCSKRL